MKAETKEDTKEQINDANTARRMKERRMEAESTLKSQKRQLSWEINRDI